MTQPTCETCKWWHIPIDDKTGQQMPLVWVMSSRDATTPYHFQCRLNAPSIGGWPVTTFQDWCGEHQAKDTNDADH